MPWSPDPGAQGVTPGWAVYHPSVAVGPDSCGLNCCWWWGLGGQLAAGAGCSARLQQCGQLVGWAGLLHSQLQLLQLFAFAGLAPQGRALGRGCDVCRRGWVVSPLGRAPGGLDGVSSQGKKSHKNHKPHKNWGQVWC